MRNTGRSKRFSLPFWLDRLVAMILLLLALFLLAAMILIGLSISGLIPGA